MKNRKTSSYENLINTSSVPNTSKNYIDSKNKRRSPGNSFFKKSTEVLQSYKTLFNKPTPRSVGDPESLFKHSLRNYDDFEISKTLNWGSRVLKPPQKPFDPHKLNKKRFASGIYFSQGDIKHKSKSRTDLVGVPQSVRSSQSTCDKKGNLRETIIREDPEEESELDTFYTLREAGDNLKKHPVPLRVDNYLKDSNLDVGVHSEDTNFGISDQLQDSDLCVGGDSLIKDTVLKVIKSAEVLESDSEKEFKMAEEELDEVEKLVDEADTTLDEVTADNPDLETTMDDTEATELETSDTKETTSGTEDEGGKHPKSGLMEFQVLKELEEAEEQAREAANIICELKKRVSQLLNKPKMTEEEAKELELKNVQLKQQMELFEAKTKKIQFLVNKASLFDNMIPPKETVSQTPHNEDMLPQVIICGITENNMPKIIVCDDQKKKLQPQAHRRSSCSTPTNVLPQFAKRLSESYSMQERLAADNADLEGKRYRLQKDVLDKDKTVECLQRAVSNLQGELRMVCKENCLLSDKLTKREDLKDTRRQSTGKMPCGKNKGPCPADVGNRLNEYTETTQNLEKQLCAMECEVRNMQCELVAVQNERQHLEQHRRMLNPCSAPSPCPPAPCPPAPCPPGPCPASPCPPTSKPPCPGPCNPNNKSAVSDQQLRELREQYNRLQDDYKSKLCEVGGLRADSEKLKQIAKDAEDSRKIAEEKVKDYERELKNYRTETKKFMGSKEQLIEQEQQLNVAKQRFREAQDELEELRALIQDQQAQLDDYRNKYLQAQQQVEEQRRQIDMMEMENNRISEQVNLEIQRVKNQFQEKLQELTPLPDILKATQLKLQETQQMHLLAERNNESLVHELQAYRDKAAAMADEIGKVRSDQQLGADEKASLSQRLQEMENKLNESADEAICLRRECGRLEELAEANETRVQEKLHEIAQLAAQLETVREESARQVARTKDRCETVRRSMQNQIADLERQLAQSRAQARSAQKDRDDIRQKMQSQINNLNENFEDAQMRIRNLQGHVNFLKSSYTTVFPSNDPLGDGGTDACDCGNNY